MGLGDMFGFGNKEKTVFRVPREVTALRIRIDGEDKENFPSLSRYKEMQQDARAVNELLSDIIRKKEHAESALKIREELKKKMDALALRINTNIREGRKENIPDYVENKIDYLQRKHTRDDAKTLFMELLEGSEEFKKLCSEGRSGDGGAITLVVARLCKTISALNNDFFKEHGGDREIGELKADTLKKVSELDTFCEENKARFEEQGLKATIASNVQSLRDAARALSEK